MSFPLFSLFSPLIFLIIFLDGHPWPTGGKITVAALVLAAGVWVAPYGSAPTIVILWALLVVGLGYAARRVWSPLSERGGIGGVIVASVIACLALWFLPIFLFLVVLGG